MAELASIYPPAPFSIGATDWSRDEMISLLPEFAELYSRRPIRDNSGGMSSTHLFLFWYALRKTNPATVIESGVFQGQGTWLIEQACPRADIICIDIDWSNLIFRSEKARYVNTDFSKQDWSGIDRDNALVFFDDHVNALERVRHCVEHGFKRAIFEDNYFASIVGDLYTLKMIFNGVGYEAPRKSIRYWGGLIKGTRSDRTVKPNYDDAVEAKSKISLYEELPPIYLHSTNRWGIDTSFVPTPRPLLDKVEEDWQKVYAAEGDWYTAMAYVEFK